MSKANYEISAAIGVVDKSTRPIGKIQSKLMSFTSKLSMRMRGLNRVMARVSDGIGKVAKVAAAGLVSLGGATWGVMKQFSKIENAQAAFTPVLGGAEKATEMVKALNDTAATTPFQFQNLSDAAKQLLPNMGGDIKKTIENIRMLGDTAGGNAQKMDSIVRGYNKALLKGKVDMESLNMIAEAGVPIFNEMAKVMNLSSEKMFKTIGKGKVQTWVLWRTLKNMTSEGGMFFKGMEIASQTLTGKISTLKDNAGLAAAEFGTVLAPTMKDITDKFIVIAQKSRQWISANKELIKSKFNNFLKITKTLLREVYDGGVEVYEWAKKLPITLDQITYYGPKIAKYAVIFYALSKAVKIASVSLEILNALTNINIAPVKKIGTFMGTTLPSKIGMSTKAVGLLKTTMIGLGTFVVAWGIADLLYDKIVKPFYEARSEIEKMKTDLDSLLAKKPKDLSSNELNEVINKSTKIRKDEQKWLGTLQMITSATTGGMAHIGIGSTKKYGRIESKYTGIRHTRNVEKYPYQGTPDISDEFGIDNAFRPSVSVSRSESSTTHKENVEVTIRDETKRARITSGSSGRLKLVHTGGMP